MKLIFLLSCLKPGAKPSNGFKERYFFEAFQEYISRISGSLGVEIRGGFPERKPQTCLWLCDSGGKPQGISSEEVSRKLEHVLLSSVKEWVVAIGPADGFSEDEKKTARPDFIWSFGAMTLPHELAAILAAEQIYRAFSILKKHPYHKA